MKLKSLIIGVLLSISLITTLSSVSAEHMQEFPTMECDNPTEFYAISAIPGELKFNITELSISKDVCFSFSFINQQESAHDLTVLDKDGEEWIHMDVSTASTDEGTGELQGSGIGTHYYKAPNYDITLQIFCEVEGHADGGMVADLIIGAGGSGPDKIPGFELPLVIAGFISMLIAIPKIRKY